MAPLNWTVSQQFYLHLCLLIQIRLRFFVRHILREPDGVIAKRTRVCRRMNFYRRGIYLLGASPYFYIVLHHQLIQVSNEGFSVVFIV